MARARKKRSRGFTLIELMIVISIILILVSVALPAYNQSILRARESVLKQNLFTLRSVISQYTLDKQKAPQSLDDLVTSGYLKQLPMDPTTEKTTPGCPTRKREPSCRSMSRTKAASSTCTADQAAWAAMVRRTTPGNTTKPVILSGVDGSDAGTVCVVEGPHTS